MNLEIIVSLSEVVGAFGIICSLIFLALQVRSNTTSLKARASYDANISWSEINERVGLAAFESNKDISKPLSIQFLEFWDDAASPHDYTPEELFPHAMILRSIFQRLEAQYWLSKHGLLEQSQWTIKASWFAGAITLPVIKFWWNKEKTLGLYSSEFLDALSKVPITDGLAKSGGQAIHLNP